jgi:hypothetical protein
MQRVFAIDVLECPSCGGRMRILSTAGDASAPIDLDRRPGSA